MRRALPAAITVLTALAFGACSGSNGAAPDVPAADTFPDVTTSPPTTIKSSPTGIARLVPTSAPSGFTLQEEDRTDTGPVDLEKAAYDDVAVDGEQVLRRSGFVRGYQRTWTSRTGLDKNTLFLYEFATPEGALAFVDHWLVTLTASADGIDPVVFEPPYIADGYGVAVSAPGFSTAVVVVAKGRFAVQAVADGAAGVSQRNAASALAGAQLARLPA